MFFSIPPKKQNMELERIPGSSSPAPCYCKPLQVTSTQTLPVKMTLAA